MLTTRPAGKVRVASVPLQPRRTVDELRELQELTGDENGAQRVAWTDTWERAREWLRAKVAGTGAAESVDAAGNQWFTLSGGSDRAVLLGGPIDSVPNGGWLDGALDVMAGLGGGGRGGRGGGAPGGGGPFHRGRGGGGRLRGFGFRPSG